MIGFCKDDPHWIHPLKELKYQVGLVEQSLSIKGGSKITPDIIFSSDKQRHILVCECKGGHTISSEQITKYEALAVKDMLRWIRLHTGEITHDICYVMFENDFDKSFNAFPALIFSKDVKKFGKKFTLKELEKKFAKAIDIGDLSPPLSYYPFSPNDGDDTIIPYVLRTMVSLSCTNEIFLEDGTLNSNKIFQSVHVLHDALSKKHQRQITEKIECIIKELSMSYPTFNELLKGNNSQKTLSKLIQTCEDILSTETSTKRITDYTSNDVP